MDQELLSYLDKRFGEMDRQFGEMSKRFDTVETDIRGLKTDVTGLKIDVKELKIDVEDLKKDTHETRILLEALRGDVQMIAEGLATGFDEGLKPLRSEYDDKIEEVRTLNRLSHSDLQRRVGVLEDWKERLAGTDPIAAVRERFGLKAKES
jgi:chromosome segregation ATPase